MTFVPINHDKPHVLAICTQQYWLFLRYSKHYSPNWVLLVSVNSELTIYQPVSSWCLALLMNHCDVLPHYEILLLAFTIIINYGVAAIIELQWTTYFTRLIYLVNIYESIAHLSEIMYQQGYLYLSHWPCHWPCFHLSGTAMATFHRSESFRVVPRLETTTSPTPLGRYGLCRCLSRDPGSPGGKCLFSCFYCFCLVYLLFIMFFLCKGFSKWFSHYAVVFMLGCMLLNAFGECLG